MALGTCPYRSMTGTSTSPSGAPTSTSTLVQVASLACSSTRSGTTKRNPCESRRLSAILPGDVRGAFASCHLLSLPSLWRRRPPCTIAVRFGYSAEPFLTVLSLLSQAGRVVGSRAQHSLRNATDVPADPWCPRFPAVQPFGPDDSFPPWVPADIQVRRDDAAREGTIAQVDGCTGVLPEEIQVFRAARTGRQAR